MNKDFENEIRAISKANLERDKEVLANKTPDSEEQDYLNVIQEFLTISEEAVNIYNSNSKTEVLSVCKLPKEFLEMFLEIPGRRGGGCIISPTRLVVFFDEDPQIITVIGEIRNSKDAQNKTSSKATQLLKVSFSHNAGKYEYKDNTGGVLLPYDIVSLLIKWVAA